MPNPRSPYAAAKLGAEAYCQAYWFSHDLPTVALRYFNVYGPRQDPDGPYAAVIPRFVLAAMDGGTLSINGDGSYSRDFTFVTDAVAANVLAAKAGAEACGQVMNIGAGGRTTIQELAETIIRAVGHPEATIAHGPVREGDVAHSHASIDKAQRLLGYVPKVAIAEGLAQTVRWFGEQNA